MFQFSTDINLSLKRGFITVLQKIHALIQQDNCFNRKKTLKDLEELIRVKKRNDRKSVGSQIQMAVDKRCLRDQVDLLNFSKIEYQFK